MREVVVTGVGMTPFRKHPDRDLKSLAAEAVTRALGDAECRVADIEYVAFANAVGGSITGQEMVAGQVCLAPLGFSSVPIINVENACASASTAFSIALQAVAAGVVDIALAVGAEKMTHPDKSVIQAAISRAADVEDVARSEAAGEITASYFMDLYARAAVHYLASTDATLEDFASVAAKNQRHGALNPLAQYGGDYTVAEVLASRSVVDPLTLLMCSPITDGAAAAIVVAADRLEAGMRERRQVRVLASQIASGGKTDRGEDRAVSVAARKAYEQAGLGPEAISGMELHDATSPAELELYEAVGIAAPGEGASVMRRGTTALGGALPVNASGGLLAKGHPIGASGLAQICEAVWQLRGVAGRRQVDKARFFLTQNGGGWVGTDNAAAAVHIFAAV